MSSLDSRFTFTRSTTATYINSSGYVTTMAAASTNDPTKARFDYDPTTLAARGLLIEGSATNLALQSNGATSSWNGGGNRTPTNNTTDLVSPDGTNNATKLVCGASSQYGSYFQSISGLTAGATYTVSYWIRGPVGHVPRLYAVNGTVGDVTATSTTGTYSNTGWTRLTQTYTLPASTTQVYVYFLSVSPIATANDTYYVYGFQLEAGSGASSYISTGASQVQRAVDICTMSNIAAINYNANGGTLFAHFSNNTENANFAGSIAFNNGGNYAQRFRWGSGVLLASYFQTNGTSALGSNLNGSRTSLGSAKAATSYSFDGTTTSTAMSVNGAQATTTSASSATSGVSIATALGLNTDNSSAGTGYASIAIRSIKFWPTGLKMAQMNALTVNP
jgi:hypothetical protein